MTHQKSLPSLSRRRFLHAVGVAGGSPLLYRSMAAMGLLGAEAACTPKPTDVVVAPNAGAGKKVVVLGGGIAGLTSAIELAKSGFDVTVLEATQRVGGRNRTARAGDVLVEEGGAQTCTFDAGDHLYMNLGPGRIAHHHERLLGYCRDFGVALEVFTNDNRAAYFHGATKPAPVKAKAFYADQRGLISELLAKAVNKSALDDELTGVDKDAFLALLDQFGGLGDAHAYVGTNRSGYAGGDAPGIADPAGLPLVVPLTIHELLGEDVFHDFRTTFFSSFDQSPTMLQPVGGMDKIVDAFRARVGDGVIRFGTVVTRIENTTDGVRVEVKSADGANDVVTADFAIVTIPASVLRDIPNNFAAELNSEIAGVSYNNAVKIGFQARRRFWELDEQIYGGITFTHQQATQMWYPSTGFHQQKGVVLAAYTWDNSFDEAGLEPATNPFFQQKSFEDRIAEAKAELLRVHPQVVDGDLEAPLTRAWGAVPFQKGGWADDNFRIQDHALQAAGEGRIRFAGEHVSNLPGWQEGAIASAHEAIASIVAAVQA